MKILIIDDEESQRDSLKGFLQKKGYSVDTAKNGTEGIENFKKNYYDLVITDFKMPDITGEEVLKQCKEINPIVPVVVITAYGTIGSAVELMKSGAIDLIEKPVDLIKLLIVIEKANERNLLISENKRLKEQLEEKYSFSSIVSQSEEMELVINTAARVAKSKATVLVRGESGTGKELIAKAIHFASDRKDKPFIVVNCAAMPETLFESELFGHERGAFTGADKQRIGKFEQAHNGTLFIDEVGDIPLHIQVKLLRAVQFGEIERLGGKSTIKIDVRIVAATNRSLEEMMKKGEFREDLYYRFNVVTIQVPPLRNRKIDVPALANFFIDKYALVNGKDISSISKEAMNVLMKYNFPGNVRELENIVQRAVVLSRSDTITYNDLPLNVREPSSNEINDTSVEDVEVGDLNKKIESIEKAMLKKALSATMGNQVKAAEMLNISERTIRYKIEKYNLK